MTDDDERIAGEEEIIDLLRPLAVAPGALGLKDDCATLTPAPGMDLVLKTDPIAEGIHFLPDDAPEDIAWKALAVNVSDLAAKGAKPVGYLMALSFPAPPQQPWLQGFARGLQAAQHAFGCVLLGGDTDRRPGPVTISVTVLGEVPAGRMVQRATAKPGDAIFVSGHIGDAHLGLHLCRSPELAGTWGLSPDEADALRLRYRRPEPRLALAGALRQFATAAMDLSDGLVKDLRRMVRASGLSAEIALARMPLSAAAARVIAREPDRLAALATAGDDYEVLATVPQAHKVAFETDAKAAGISVAEIGNMLGPPSGLLRVIGPDGREMHLQSEGWEHF